MKKLFPMVTATFIALGILFGLQATALAAKARFQASVSPQTLSLAVNARGGITGIKTIKVGIQRIQVGRTASVCNKIKAVEVLKGVDPFPLDEQQLLTRYGGFGGRGKCFFDINLIVQPFSDEEIRGVCQGVSSGNQSLLADGLVTAWNKDSAYLAYLRDMRRKGGTGGGIPKNKAQLRYAAKVKCGSSSTRDPGPGPGPGPTPPGPQAHNMQGWWKLSSRIAGRDGDWQFTKTSLSQRQGRYSTKGPATKRYGRITYGSVSGNATLDANKSFIWNFNDRVTCSGRINNSYSIVVGTCKGSGYRPPKSSFKLTKSKGLSDISVKPSPVGEPIPPAGGVEQRDPPRLPGDTFNPRSPLPPKPRW